MVRYDAPLGPIEGFHRDAKQTLGLEDYQVRKIKGVKRHIAMVFFAYVLLQLGSGFDRIVGNLVMSPFH